MKIFDISMPVDDNIVVWEDDFKPEIKRYSKIEAGDLSNTSFIRMDLHTGTHIDFPYHFLEDGKKSHDYTIDHFIMDVLVVEIKKDIINNKVLKQIKIPETVEGILFKTKNNILYKLSNFSNHYTCLDSSGANYLIDKHLKLVGIDYLSIEKQGNSEFPVHKALLSHNILILEGLYLENIKEGIYRLYAIPMKINNVEALPARAFLIEEDR